MTGRWDVVCVGGGIVGLATAMTLARSFRLRVAVIEAEPKVAAHQTGHNSGVIHSGLYYRPGSVKAKTCVEGRRRLIELCDAHDVPYELCGKLVIASEEEEVPRLEELHRRGEANGLVDLRRIDGDAISELEPHARGRAALWVPQTGIVDFVEVARLYARLFLEAGGHLLLESRLVAIHDRSGSVVLETTGGDLEARFLVNCAGLQSDRVARLAGVSPGVRIVPFRGDYFDLVAERRHLLRGLVYPVPDPRFPFLGVHLTRRLDGSVEAGPNAVLSLHREGYGSGRFDLRDAASALLYPGLWRLGLRYWRVGLGEYLRAGSPARFTAALRRFVPQIGEEDLVAGGCGIRAQALAPDGSLLDDFAIERGSRSLHILNAPSPAATASLSIADQIVEMIRRHSPFDDAERRAGA